MKKRTLRSTVFRYMIGVIAITAVIRIVVWGSYQFFEIKQGHIVYHEQINEFMLLLLVEVVGVAILIFFLWRLSRMLLSPLRSVSNAATLISRGSLDKRIRTEHLPEGELTEIANALNKSFDSYQDTIDRITRFSDAASHQLRTPLAAIRNTAELSIARDKTADQHVQALESILEDTDHLTRMTEQLLLLSRMNVEHLQENFSALDMNDSLRRVIDMYQPTFEAKDITLHAELANSCPVYGDSTLLMEALMNLVDNAAKWTPDGGDITITTATNSHSLFCISDSGPGIEEAFREHLFERFHRHPSTPYQGSGLGLSIVHEVANLHRGHVNFSTGKHGGACFELSLPAIAYQP